MMFGRRPGVGQSAFGHVDLDASTQKAIDVIVAARLDIARHRTEITYDPDDTPASGEVMVTNLGGIDGAFQPAAAWSLERSVKAIGVRGKPTPISKGEVEHGGWTFYVLRSTAPDGTDVVLIRHTSPTRALKHSSRVLTQFTGSQLHILKNPLVGIDHEAEAIIAGGVVYIFHPQTLERLFIDADEIKARAPQIAAKFEAGLSAKLSSKTGTWIEKACSDNSNVGRRVERLNRTAALRTMSVDKLRAGLSEARLPANAFGSKKTIIELDSLDHAVALIDIAADLYYQPRFEASSRKVASFRRIR